MNVTYRATAVLGLVLLSAFGPSAALAHDHEPPRAELRGSGSALKLGYWTSVWTSSSGPGCATGVSDGIPDYRPRLLVRREHPRTRVVFYKDQRPQYVSLREYPRSRDGRTIGPGRRVEVDLRPRSEAGAIVGWSAAFRGTVRGRSLYEMSAGWLDEEGCGALQEVSTSFRLARTG